MSKIIITLFLFLGYFFVNAQDSTQKVQEYKLIKTWGASYGGETLLGFPKGDIIIEFQGKKIKPYIGVGGSMFFIFAGLLSTNIQTGIRYKFITLDANLARTKSIKHNTDTSPGKNTYSSFNPKIGFRTLRSKKDDIWFKIGPAFIFDISNSFKGTFIPSFNIEIIGIIK